MSKTITFMDAVVHGIVNNGDYFECTNPKKMRANLQERSTGIKREQFFQIKEGEKQLWRLEKGLKMWGEPTRKTLSLSGEIGFNQSNSTMNYVARKLYGMEEFFETVQSCSLPEKRYDRPFLEIKKLMQEESEKYGNPDDKELSYWLASRCIIGGETYTLYKNFYVGNNRLDLRVIFNPERKIGIPSLSVRPEATPRPTLLLETEGVDGSRERPWKCISK